MPEALDSVLVSLDRSLSDVSVALAGHQKRINEATDLVRKSLIDLRNASSTKYEEGASVIPKTISSDLSFLANAHIFERDLPFEYVDRKIAMQHKLAAEGEYREEGWIFLKVVFPRPDQSWANSGWYRDTVISAAKQHYLAVMYFKPDLSGFFQVRKLFEAVKDGAVVHTYGWYELVPKNKG